jgi:4-carboxymuconolactone decarboxylase
MSRIPEITQREQLPEAKRHHYDAIVSTRGSLTAPYRYLLHAPELAARMAHLMSYTRFEPGASSFPADIKELAIITVARALDCVYEWGDHEQRALDAGVRREAVEAIKAGRAPEGLNADEAVVVNYLQQLLRPPHRIADDVFNALRARLGDAHLVELTGIVGGYSALACTFNAFNVPPGPGLPVLPT